MPSSNTLLHLFDDIDDQVRDSAPIAVCNGSSIANGAGLLAMSQAGKFASASRVSMLNIKDVNINEIVNSALNKLPRLWTKVN